MHYIEPDAPSIAVQLGELSCQRDGNQNSENESNPEFESITHQWEVYPAINVIENVVILCVLEVGNLTSWCVIACSIGYVGKGISIIGIEVSRSRSYSLSSVALQCMTTEISKTLRR